MKIKAILIDDEPDNREVFSECLDCKGIDVVARGTNGKEALELYKKFKPDIVLMDVLMPEYDGFYGLEKIRQFDPYAKVVFVTASLSNIEPSKIFDSKVSAVIVKPFEMEELIQTIERINKKQNVAEIP